MRGKNKIKILYQLQNALRLRQFTSSSVTLHQVSYSKKQNKNIISTFRSLSLNQSPQFLHSLTTPHDQSAVDFNNILKNHRGNSTEEIERILEKCGLVLTEELALQFVNRNQSDWKPVYTLFQLIHKQSINLSTPSVHNEILNVLGKMRRFEEFQQVFDEMSQRDEKTYQVLLNRYAASHKVDEALDIYKKRREFGIEDDYVAFNIFLMWLCRYKHVEFAETLFVSYRQEFGYDIKAMNIILNGWCVLGNVHEAKRVFKDILASKCRPDVFTYGTMINALTKKGKLGKALELYRSMWETGRSPDVNICNNVIDALCFKKRIPEGLEVLKEMVAKGCMPNVVTYNSILKHMCKIRRTAKVWELVEEMEERGGSCSPNDRTFGYLIKYSRGVEEVDAVLERMEKDGVEMTSDLYNLVFRLYVGWGNEERVREVWSEMEKKGLGPDQRTYTVRIHGLHTKGKIGEALGYYHEMISKGMVPEPRTEILINQNKTKPKEEDNNKLISIEEYESDSITTY